MRQLFANGESPDYGVVKDSYYGIVYLSWSNNRNRHIVGQPDEFRKLWRAFAEQEAGHIFRSSTLDTEQHWMSDDLFMLIKLPEGRKQILEGWLLELFYKESMRLEQRFIQQLNCESANRLSGGLQVGLSIVELDKEFKQGNDNFWYEALKQAILQGQSAASMELSLKRKAFHQLIAQQLIYPVYQPIIALQSSEVFGYEALTRLRNQSWFEGPMQLFEFAAAEGQTYVLDRLAREKAIDGCMSLKMEQKLFINVMAQIMEDPSFSPGQTITLLEQQRLSPQNVVFEITERSSIEDFGSVKKALEHYRNQGYQIAIDDVGAGYSSLQSIVELRPDYLKIDRSIIHHIDQDEVKSYILNTLLELGAKMGISLIAEGIERSEELEQLRGMGVQYAQGYLLGKPAVFPA